MAGGSSPVGNTATLNLVLGVFLKLLGFFVVLYSYTEVNAVKVQKVEHSLKEQFNISVSLTPVLEGLRPAKEAPLVQTKGRAYTNMENDMKSQVDLLSSEYNASSNTLILRIPAEIAMDIDTKLAKSPNFADILNDTLKAETDSSARFAVELIVSGSDDAILMRSVSLFVQKLIGHNYPQELLTIGYADSNDKPMLEIRIKQVSA